MIVPMKKCLVVITETGRTAGLKSLARLGIVHVEPVNGTGEPLAALRADRELIERAVGALSSFKVGKDARPAGLSPVDAARRVEEIQAAERASLDRSGHLTRERDLLAPLGEFDPESLKAFDAAGYVARVHALGAKEGAESFPQGTMAVELGRERGKSYFLSIVGKGAGSGSEALPPAMPLPDEAKSAIEAEIEREAEARRALRGEKAALAALLPGLRSELERVKRLEAFENIRSGMPNEGSLAYLTGWVPAEKEAELAREASARGWGLSTDDPGDDEMPPTKVKTNAFIRIIQPVFDFLGTVPNYREYEISAWFLVFFCVFFAMIFGDGGYGAIMLAASAALIVSAKAKGRKIPDFSRLLLVLSVFTLAWGAMTGSWFSMPDSALPGLLKKLAVPGIEGWNPESGDNVKVICFIIGSVQLFVAHLKNIARDIRARSLKFIGQIGSFLLVFGMFWLVLNLVIDAARFPMPNYAPFAILAGFLLVFLFSNYERNVLQSAVDGLKNIIPTFLGTVSVFADIVSYIRLWAVGLAGAAISQTVNGMAAGLFEKPSPLMAAGVLLLVLGHGLNIVMSVLSVVVHGVRLNMLEFSGHLGMDWSGYAYEPLREAAQAGVSIERS
jgi:V/A-type H+/Na+-transporting ATPase subunit I